MHLSFNQFLVLALLAFLGAAALAFTDLRFSDLIGNHPPSVERRIERTSGGNFDFPVIWAEVDDVVDGDTIRLRDGNYVRYIGIDTPESEENPPEYYAKEATRRNRKLVDGERVALRKDRSEVDRYGRMLRYVYLEDGRMVNEILLEEGYAVAAEFRPDTLFTRRFAALEREAKAAKRGLWQK